MQSRLARLSREGSLYDRLPDGSVRCWACAHECRIREGRAGICRVRFNEDGRLKVPFGYAAGLQVDPIEKKPFFHVLPGSATLSFGMLGCSLRCRFCQNWVSSQALRDPEARAPVQECSAEWLIGLAKDHGVPVVTSTYNEPLVTAEWAMAVFEKARAEGLRTAFVSNGFASERALKTLRPWVDFFKVDLKCFDDRTYRNVMGARLSKVLAAIETLACSGTWVEVVTLVVPGMNDSDEALRGISKFLAGVSKDIPWHVTAFHGDYKMAQACSTPARTLERAAWIGRAEGLRYVYAGNLPEAGGGLEDTRCAGCSQTLVQRRGFRVLSNIIMGGRCPKCSSAVAGVWG
ncbi:MAG: AmmeMemoRadiSam system radical SAM enzyme [Elusimicrobiota bacterium]